MNGNNNLVFTVLAVIGAVVVALFVLKVAFKLIGLAILVGIAVLVYMFIQNLAGKGR